MSAASMASLLAQLLAEITERSAGSFPLETPLVGGKAAIRSRELVELLLAVEDALDRDYGLAFDWSSDQAMSAASSRYRTVGSFAEHLASLVAK